MDQLRRGLLDREITHHDGRPQQDLGMNNMMGQMGIDFGTSLTNVTKSEFSEPLTFLKLVKYIREEPKS